MISDFVVIGAGIIGLTTARELAKRGAKVTVLERSSVDGQASWASAGILAVLSPWAYSQDINQLADASANMYPALVDELLGETGVDAEYERSGALVLPPYDEDKAFAWCRDNPAQAQKTHAKKREPALQTRSAAALWLPGVAQVRTPRLLQALKQSAVLRAIEMFEHVEVSRVNIAHGRARSVSTSRGEITAHGVVVCAGAWSQQLLGELAMNFKTQPVKGQILLFKQTPDFLKSIVLQKDYYLVPRRDGHVLAGSSLEHSGFDSSTTPAFKEEILRWTSRLVPGLDEQVLVQQWAGLRPKSHSPTISRHPQVENLFVNGGHFRYGVTMAPGSASLIARLIFREELFDAFQWPSECARESTVAG